MRDTVDEVGRAMDASCAHHPDEAAVAPCRRCGGFLCAACTLHGTEDRCLSCRPRRTAEERRERRENAVRRSAWMCCEACGYRGPQFRKTGWPTGSDLLSLVLLPFLGVGFIIAIVLALRGFSIISCPTCETRDSLWPAPMEGALPDSYRAAQARERSQWLRLRAPGVAITLGILVAEALLFVLVMWSAA